MRFLSQACLGDSCDNINYKHFFTAALLAFIASTLVNAGYNGNHTPCVSVPTNWTPPGFQDKGGAGFSSYPSSSQQEKGQDDYPTAQWYEVSVEVEPLHRIIKATSWDSQIDDHQNTLVLEDFYKSHELWRLTDVVIDVEWSPLRPASHQIQSIAISESIMVLRRKHPVRKPPSKVTTNSNAPSKDIEAKYGLDYEEPIIRSLITNLGRDEAWKRLEYCAANPGGMYNRPQAKAQDYIIPELAVDYNRHYNLLEHIFNDWEEPGVSKVIEDLQDILKTYQKKPFAHHANVRHNEDKRAENTFGPSDLEHVAMMLRGLHWSIGYIMDRVSNLPFRQKRLIVAMMNQCIAEANEGQKWYNPFSHPVEMEIRPLSHLLHFFFIVMDFAIGKEACKKIEKESKEMYPVALAMME